MKPQFPQKCEICKIPLLIVFDARIKLCQFGPKGHWMFLCPMCHYVFGIGYGEDDLIIYESIAGRYCETTGERYKMTPDELRTALNSAIEESGEDSKMALLAEIAVQLASMNKQFEVLTGYMMAIEHHLKPPQVEIKAFDERVTIDVNQNDDNL